MLPSIGGLSWISRILIMASAGAYEAGNGAAMGPSTRFYRLISDKTDENDACQESGKVIMRIVGAACHFLTLPRMSAILRGGRR